MEKSETIGALATALAKAQGQMQAAIKDATNPTFRSRYADLASIVNAIRKPLADNELSYSQVPGITPEGLVMVETILMHSSGEWIAGTLAMQPTAIKQGGAVVAIPPGEMGPQVVGSVILYARRYGLQSIVGIPSDDDDDGNAASGNTTQQARQQAKPQPRIPDGDIVLPTGRVFMSAEQRAEAREEPDAPAPQNGEPKTDAQRRKLYALMKQLQWNETDIDRAATSQFGTITKNLTKQQTIQFIDTLEKVQSGEV